MALSRWARRQRIAALHLVLESDNAPDPRDRMVRAPDRIGRRSLACKLGTTSTTSAGVRSPCSAIRVNPPRPRGVAVPARYTQPLGRTSPASNTYHTHRHDAG